MMMNEYKTINDEFSQKDARPFRHPLFCIQYSIFLGLLLLIGCNESNENTNPVLSENIVETDSLAPIMLDDIHYYTLDRAATNQFFEQNFGTRAMLEDSPNPFEFIDFQLVRRGQSTINISKQGPFPGIRVGDPARWQRKPIEPSPDNPPRYGVHWLALGTKNLAASKAKLKENGVEIVEEDFQLPYSDAKAMLCYGPDYNLIVVTEKTNDQGATPYFVDHLLLLVEDLSANRKFFTEVFRGREVIEGVHYVVMEIANHTFVLAEPEALGIERETVLRREAGVFKPDIDHLGFLYENLQPAYDNAIANNYTFLSKPIPISYYDKPTLYTFAITYSPDKLQCELFEEKGRVSSRAQYR
ncbi:MAG: hypothetical protein AAF806_07150 [Bacteroidota bacterium]